MTLEKACFYTDIYLHILWVLIYAIFPLFSAKLSLHSELHGQGHAFAKVKNMQSCLVCNYNILGVREFSCTMQIRNRVVFDRCKSSLPGCIAQLVMCLTTDARLTADSGVASLITAGSHTYVEID